MIEYLIESLCCFAILYLIYILGFKKAGYLQLNRWFLLSAVLFSLVVPVLEVSLPTPAFASYLEVERIPVVMENDLTSDSFRSSFILQSSPQQFYFSDWVLLLIPVIYISVCSQLLFRFCFQLYNITQHIRKSKTMMYDGYKVRVLDGRSDIFTFFRWVGVGSRFLEKQKLKRDLIIHEYVHKNQLHSVDIVFIELLCCFFWFNPFVYLFKHEIKSNHEFLADDIVLQSGISFKEYSEHLISYTFRGESPGLASGFGFRSIKERLIMLGNRDNKQPLPVRMAVLLAVVAFLTFNTAVTPAIQDNTHHAASNTGYPDQQGLDQPGTLVASTITWSGKNNEIYLEGNGVRIKHGENDFTVSGRASYLDEVHYFVFNGKEVKKDRPIRVHGKTCSVIKLTPEQGRAKYGRKGRFGVVEITVLPAEGASK
ncbi:MAG: M56 family metallopeptidase [Bacteroidota bacterium]